MAENNNWYVLIGSQKYGPYEYKTIIEMLQANQLMDFNYVWAEHLENWTPIYQLEEFSKDRFQLILQNETELHSAFIKRKGKRLEMKIPVVGHNSIRFFDGEIISISESGALCLINSPLVQVGDKIKLHVKAGGGNAEQSFNVEAEIVRKNFSKKRLNSKSGLHYAVRFSEVQASGLRQIRQWLQQDNKSVAA